MGSLWEAYVVRCILVTLVGVDAVPGPGLDGAAGSKPDDGAVGMPERLPLSAA